ncbi:tyrosine-protein phosphatase non-receptor type substrate 1 [Ictalurus punctatus]|uniref:Tyrosine-protein phosphatase non-receptor type substrate 1 n=1 Tax=Ictalurus punctatus TaxID=7998 RepID=A0A2D0S2J1_ICTPU|nr:tyrosine-protein phosphatase non-receptor type substrate 1 [Ictalurus punctatus]XP_017336662.1 tyrosine-protein phosphatase non-receptor type substrate 1 [Ictalurus punctatus]
MKLVPLHTLVLLSVFLHSGSFSDCDGQFEPLFVQVGENATINCSIPDPDQDGVYFYRQRENTESLFYYFKDGTLTPVESVKGRVETNKNLRDFSVSISNVSENDSGVYWCKFNKLDSYNNSPRTCLIIQSGNNIFNKKICRTESECNCFMNWIVIAVLSLIVVVLAGLLVKLCCDRGQYTPKQHPSNGVYEVMRGNTARALNNPAYESSQRRTHSDLS